jgi:putative ABC transport system permease protein
MIRNYFKVIYRSLIRNKTYSIINILGLSAGLAMCIIILEYVKYEKSYDRFHSKSKDIYRVIIEFNDPGQAPSTDAANYAPAGQALKNDFPEVISATCISPEYGRVVLQYNEKAFEEQKVYYADSSFFSVFDFKLLEGDPKTALAEPASIILSRTSAERYFGKMDQWKRSPLNELIRVNNGSVMKVTGIMENIPGNSHFQGNILISLAEYARHNDFEKNWGWNDFYTYICLRPNTNPEALQAKMPGFVTKYMGKETNKKMLIQPLESIHLYSNHSFELEPNGSAQAVKFLTAIAIIILVIAWVNYINLSTARGEGRGKEVSMRKVSGASRNEVMVQFLFESFYINLIAFILAIGIVQISLPFVSALLEKPLEFSIIRDIEFVKILAVLYIIGSVMSGLYPAIILSSFRPLHILKSSSGSIARGKSGLRQSLVVFQFVMSVGLITGTVIIMNQMHFLRTKDLGFNIDKTLIINAPSTVTNDSIFFNRYQFFKQQALKYPGVENVTISSALPGKLSNDLDSHGSIRLQDKQEQRLSFLSFRIDEDFIKVFDMKLIAGRNIPFATAVSRKDSLMLINRKAAEHFGYNNPEDIVGKKVNYQGRIREVVGVIENYHHKSLKTNFEPMLLRNSTSGALYISVRLSPANALALDQIIQDLEQQWKTVYPENPFAYSFLDSHVNNQYKADAQFSKIFTVFAFFSIAISCLGLFGLVSYTITVRIKEIGVRKVLGASVENIIMLFSKDYIKLLMIASVIGLPLSYYILNLWLENFAYKAAISWWLFILPICVVTFLAFLAVSVQIMRAALTNPVDSLRHE